MKQKAISKLLVDAAMTALLLFQMGYHLWGELTHAWASSPFFVCQLLNRRLVQESVSQEVHRFFWLAVMVYIANSHDTKAGILAEKRV